MFINSIAAIFLLAICFLGLWLSSSFFKKFDLFATETLTFFFLVYLIIFGLGFDTSVYNDLFSILRVTVILTLGIISLFFGVFIAKSSTFSFVLPHRRTVIIFSLIYLLLLVFSFYIKFSRYGLSLFDFVVAGKLSDYIGDYLAPETTLENLVGMLSMFFSFYPILWIEENMKSKKKIAAIILIVVFLLLPMFLTTVTRLRIIISILLFFVFNHFYKKKIKVVSLFFLLLLFSILLILLNWYRGAGFGAEFNLDAEFVQHTFEGDLSPFTNLKLITDRLVSGNLNYEWGADVLYFFFGIIPRFFWEAKPITSFEPRMTIEIFGSIGHEFGVQTFTIFGYGFAQFSYIGVIVFCFIYGYLLKWGANTIESAYSSKLSKFYFLIFMVIGLRSSIQFIVQMLLIYLAIPFLVSLFNRIKF